MFVERSKALYSCKMSYLEVDEKDSTKLLSGVYDFRVHALSFDKARNLTKRLIVTLQKQNPGVYRDCVIVSIEREEQIVYY